MAMATARSVASAKIAGKKERQDKAKTKLYSKFGKLILSCVTEKGADVSSNLALAKLVDEAKKLGVPKEILARNMKKDSAAGKHFNEVVYECYGAGGLGFVIEGLTDNVNRAAAEVRAAITKSGGKLASEGSVLFNFEKRGVLVVERPGDAHGNDDIEEERGGGGHREGEGESFDDAVLTQAIEAGAIDVAVTRRTIVISTDTADWGKVRDALTAKHIDFDLERSGLKYEPVSPVRRGDVNVEDLALNQRLMERLLDLDDVDAVYSQMDGNEEEHEDDDDDTVPDL